MNLPNNRRALYNTQRRPRRRAKFPHRNAAASRHAREFEVSFSRRKGVRARYNINFSMKKQQGGRELHENEMIAL